MRSDAPTSAVGRCEGRQLSARAADNSDAALENGVVDSPAPDVGSRIKTRERVRALAEAYSHEREVDAMLDPLATRRLHYVRGGTLDHHDERVRTPRSKWSGHLLHPLALDCAGDVPG